MLWLKLMFSCAPVTASPDAAVRDAVEVAVGDPSSAHAGCYRDAAGAVWCWGGSNVALNFVGPQPGPWRVELPAPATQLVSWNRGHCAVLSDGDVACWRGFNGHATGERVGIHGVVELAAGLGHLCAALDDGSVACWGAGLNGVLGESGWVEQPTRVPGLRDVARVSAGGQTTCVQRRDGAVSCFGDLSAFGLQPAVQGPTLIPQLAGARRLAVGWGRVCVEAANGEVGCVSDPKNGLEKVTFPRPELPVDALAAGGTWACVARGGQVWCWGQGPLPPVADSATLAAIRARTAAPWKVGDLDDASGLSLFARYACATTRIGAVRCWGYGAYGELGDGEVHDSPDRATWLTRYAPAMLPEPKGGVYGCTSDESARRSCLKMGVDCRLFPPPDAWDVPMSGVDRSGDIDYQRLLMEELSLRPVPTCMCSCGQDYIEAQRAHQERLERECCPP